MRFSYTAVWEDTVRLIRAHGSLAAAIAGVFLFLPALVFGHLLPMPTTNDPNQFFPLIIDHIGRNIHWIALTAIAGMTGTIAILLLVFRPGLSVGGAVAAGLALMPFYFVANFLATFVILGGLVLLFVPGLYLIGRLLPLAALLVAENRKNPADAITRTWALTKGHGWAVLGLFVLIFVAGFILVSVVGGIIGTILALALSDNLSFFLNQVVSSLLNTALQVVFIFLYAAVYRALTARTEAVSGADLAKGPRGPARMTGETDTSAGTGTSEGGGGVA